jgi:hypothetical protein
MRRLAVVSLLLAGCPWVSNKEFDAVWDVDGDGWGYVDDCGPDDPLVYPGAPDPRGDGCDDDCGVEPDADGDDWPDDADCDDTDATRFPCSGAEVDGDDVDHDCDGFDGVRPAAATCPSADPDDPEVAARDLCAAPALD